MNYSIKVIFLIFGALLASGCGQKDSSAEQRLISKNTESVQLALDGYWINQKLQKQITDSQSLVRGYEKFRLANSIESRINSDWEFISPKAFKADYTTVELPAEYPYEIKSNELSVRYDYGDESTREVRYALIESDLACAIKSPRQCMQRVSSSRKDLPGIVWFSYKQLLQGVWQDKSRNLIIRFQDDGIISGLPFDGEYKLVAMTLGGDLQVIGRKDQKMIKTYADMKNDTDIQSIDAIGMVYKDREYNASRYDDYDHYLAFKRSADNLELFLVDNIGDKGEKPTSVTGKLIFSGKLLKNND